MDDDDKDDFFRIALIMMMTIMMKATNVTIRLSKSKEGAARRQDGENSRRWKNINIRFNFDLLSIIF